MEQLSVDQLKRKIPEKRQEIVQAVMAGLGLAVYEDGQGVPRVLTTYGGQGADIPGRFPPATYSDGVGLITLSLGAYVAPGGPTAETVSTQTARDRFCLDSPWSAQSGQINLPRRPPPTTEYPQFPGGR